MCHLDGLNAAQKSLPFPDPLNKLWINVHKFIDVFHLRNHINPRCHQVYNPDRLATELPDMNTQAGEQTFTWIARFRHIVCAMNKHHHLFYIHRMVLRRNIYTSKCYAQAKSPFCLKFLVCKSCNLKLHIISSSYLSFIFGQWCLRRNRSSTHMRTAPPLAQK